MHSQLVSDIRDHTGYVRVEELFTIEDRRDNIIAFLALDFHLGSNRRLCEKNRKSTGSSLIHYPKIRTTKNLGTLDE